jgi:hypothetical protein
MGSYDESERKLEAGVQRLAGWAAKGCLLGVIAVPLCLLVWWCIPNPSKPFPEKPDPPFSEAELRAMVDYQREISRISTNLDRLAHEWNVAETDLTRSFGCNLTRKIQADYFMSKTVPVAWSLSGVEFHRSTSRTPEPGESLTPKESEEMWRRFEEERSK